MRLALVVHHPAVVTMAVPAMAVLTLSLPLLALACGGTCLGTNVSTLDLHAQLAATTVYSSDVHVTGVGVVGDANAWRKAIADASAGDPASGIVMLSAPHGDALWVRLPLPLSPGQSLPITGEVSLSAKSPFTFVSPADTTRVGAWLGRCLIDATNDPCALAQRQEVVDGTVRVVSVRPLRARLSASVSYGTATALAPVTLDGDLAFAATQGTTCQD